MEQSKSLQWMVDESKAGDASAFRMLYDKTRDDLFRFIRYRTSTREDAVDLLQDCYVDFWKCLKEGRFNYASDKELLSFLYLLARRRVSKLYLLWKPRVSLDDLADMPEDVEESPGEASAAVSALSGLGRSDREVIELRYFSGLSFQEIAKLLNKGESAVKVRHHRAIAKLKQRLGYEKE